MYSKNLLKSKRRVQNQYDCYASGMTKSAMITECRTPHINHRDTFSPYKKLTVV